MLGHRHGHTWTCNQWWGWLSVIFSSSSWSAKSPENGVLVMRAQHPLGDQQSLKLTKVTCWLNHFKGVHSFSIVHFESITWSFICRMSNERVSNSEALWNSWFQVVISWGWRWWWWPWSWGWQWWWWSRGWWWWNETSMPRTACCPKRGLGTGPSSSLSKRNSRPWNSSFSI